MAATAELQRLLYHEVLCFKELRSARKEIGKCLADLRRSLSLEISDVAKGTGLKGRGILDIETGNGWSELAVKRLTDFFAFHANAIDRK